MRVASSKRTPLLPNQVHHDISLRLVLRCMFCHSARLPRPDLVDTGQGRVLEAAFERLILRDPRHPWTSGRWMTERSGGSDVPAQLFGAGGNYEQYAP